MKKKFPAFRLYSKEWLSSMNVRSMDAEQKGWFITLLVESWECSPQCFLPDNDDVLRVLAGAIKADTSRWHEVLKMFVKKRGKIFNKRLLGEFMALRAFQRKKSKAGANGALRRWHSHSTAMILPMANDSSASASASAMGNSTETHTHNAAWPTLRQVLDKAQFSGIPPEAAEQFWNHFESSGWVDRNGNAIRRWESKLATWSIKQRAVPLEQAHKAGESTPRNDFWKNSEQLKQVEAEIRSIEARASETPLGLIIENRDKSNYQSLKAKRFRLKKDLGLK